VLESAPASAARILSTIDWKEDDESGGRGGKKGERKSAPLSFGSFRNNDSYLEVIVAQICDDL
jgi:hypothetical protein